MKTLENINTCVNNDSAYNIIVNQKELLYECESAAVVTNKQCEQLFNDILCKNKEITTALIENSDALTKAEDEFTNQVTELSCVCVYSHVQIIVLFCFAYLFVIILLIEKYFQQKLSVI